MFDNISSVSTPDPHTAILTLDHADGNFLFRMGENTAVILHPKSAAQAANRSVGTGPYVVQDWCKDSSITLAVWPGARVEPKLKRVTFRFVNDPAARVAALLAGDVDAMPRLDAPQAVKQLQADRRFAVETGATAS